MNDKELIEEAREWSVGSVSVRHVNGGNYEIWSRKRFGEGSAWVGPQGREGL